MSSVIPPTPQVSDYASDDRDFSDISVSSDPFVLFKDWMQAARAAEVNDANAMSVATVDSDGLPDVRVVLLKEIDEHGFVFYTNAGSAKGEQLRVGHAAGGAKVALGFHWKSLKQAVRIRGAAEPVQDTQADAYFASRARGSQIGAWASLQSSPLDSRATLHTRIAELTAKFDGKDVPRPDNWYGWRVIPQTIEFWRDRPYRLHDRLVFSRDTVGAPWTTQRLYP